MFLLSSWQMSSYTLWEAYVHVDPKCMPWEKMYNFLKMTCSAYGFWLFTFIYLDAPSPPDSFP